MPSKGKDGPNSVWQDRDIKFDVNPSLLDLRKGEFLIDRLSRVEDTKGNNGEAGELSITNLRVIWQSNRHAHTNLSIGYNSIVSINIKSASSAGPTTHAPERISHVQLYTSAQSQTSDDGSAT